MSSLQSHPPKNQHKTRPRSDFSSIWNGKKTHITSSKSTLQASLTIIEPSSFFEAPVAICFFCTMAQWSIRWTSGQRDAVNFASFAMIKIGKETVTI